MMKTDPYEFANEYLTFATSAECSLVTVQNHSKYNYWIVADDRTQEQRMIDNNDIDIGHYVLPGETGRFELPTGTLRGKVLQQGKKGMAAVTKS